MWVTGVLSNSRRKCPDSMRDMSLKSETSWDMRLTLLMMVWMNSFCISLTLPIAPIILA